MRSLTRSLAGDSIADPCPATLFFTAIQYAQTLGSPDFKFNKGRQNWLMRNVYSASEVREPGAESGSRR